jgi:hypothetical protein
VTPDVPLSEEVRRRALGAVVLAMQSGTSRRDAERLVAPILEEWLAGDVEIDLLRELRARLKVGADLSRKAIEAVLLLPGPEEGRNAHAARLTEAVDLGCKAAVDDDGRRLRPASLVRMLADAAAELEGLEAPLSARATVGEVGIATAADYLGEMDPVPGRRVWGPLCTGNSTLVVGEPGCGKSWIVLHVAVAAATGRGDVLNHGGPDAPLRVLYAAGGDGSAEDLRSRLRLLGGLGDLHVLRRAADHPSIETVAGGRWLLRVASGFDVLLLDTVSRWAPGLSELDGTGAKALSGTFTRITEGGAALLVVHHAPRDGRGRGLPRSGRGLSALEADFDNVLAIGRDDRDRDLRRFAWLKVRNGVEPAPGAFRIVPPNGALVVEVNPATGGATEGHGPTAEGLHTRNARACAENRDRVAAAVREGRRTVRDITETTGIPTRTVERHLAQLSQAGEVRRVRGGPGAPTLFLPKEEGSDA